MKKNMVLKYQGLCLLLIILSINLPGICQSIKPINIQTDIQKETSFNVPDISTKVGEALPSTGLGENHVKNALHEDSKHTGRPAPLGITVFGPCELPFSDARAGSDLEKRLNTTCAPAISSWPTSESYFDVFWFVSQNEYVIDRPLGQTAYIWGYLASRK
jgi:hypothetical protein